MNFSLDRNIGNIRDIDLGPRRKARAESSGFAGLLGSAWERLDPAIRERFATAPPLGRPRVFAGRFAEVRRSMIGWCFALICRAVGHPLPLSNGSSTPARVVVARLEDEDGCVGVEWRRYYGFKRRAELCRTVKREDATEGLLECVGRHFGMTLALSEEGGELHFRSQRFFLRFGGLRLTWPLLLSPGRMHVLHAVVGEGRFRFRLTVDHPLFGRTFLQDGVFCQMEG